MMFKKLVLLIIFINGLIYSRDLITPIPFKVDFDEEKVLLGKKLFYDTRLSHNNTISCASCHFLEDGGDDNQKVSFGINGKKGLRNSPTVLNARYNFVQFWDGSAKNLQEQAKVPIHNPVEMSSNFNEVIIKLKKDKIYITKFHKIYKNGITGDNITDAISEFEKTLITPNSRFDKYLRGDKNALTSNELNGYKYFKEYGCISCHNGINIGGNLIQKIGIIENYKTDDLGRFNITKNLNDKYYFKVPTLRNIELTAPYFHNGEIQTLKQVVLLMIKYQVGYIVKDKEVDDIVDFLKTLTGETSEILKYTK